MVDKDIKHESESVNLMWSLIASILNAISNYKEVCWVVQTLSLVSLVCDIFISKFFLIIKFKTLFIK